MNLQEFSALKVGDRVCNPMNGSEGVVSETPPNGVKVIWGRSTLEFTYTVVSTAWMHWGRVSDDETDMPVL